MNRYGWRIATGMGVALLVSSTASAQTAAEVTRVDSANNEDASRPARSLEYDSRPYVAPMLSVVWPKDSNGAEFDPGLGGTVAIGKPFFKYLTGEVFANFAGRLDMSSSAFERVDVFQYGLSALVFPVPDTAPVYFLASYGLSQFDFDRVAEQGDEPSETGSFWDVGAGARLALADVGIPDPWGISVRAEYRYRSADVNVELGSNSTADAFDIDGHIFQIGFQIPILPPAD